VTLLWAHRILIGTAIVASLVFGVYEIIDYRETGAPASLAMGVAALGVLVGLCFYFRWFLRKIRK
jgi:hypothetical protein